MWPSGFLCFALGNSCFCRKEPDYKVIKITLSNVRKTVAGFDKIYAVC